MVDVPSDFDKFAHFMSKLSEDYKDDLPPLTYGAWHKIQMTMFNFMIEQMKVNQ